MNESRIMGEREKGSVLVLVAGLLLVLTGFAILGFDIGRIFIVRNEMQNAADAAALAGANCLTRQSKTGSATDCISTLSTSLNWTTASAKAINELGNNTADNQALETTGTGYQVDVGYWSLLAGSPSGGAFSTAFSPITVNDKPAVRVTITKDTGMNFGPITMLTNRIFGGGADVPMTASAVAVISSPGNVPPDSLLPQVINKCLYDQFWNASTGTPVIYTGNPSDPNGISVVGQPWEFRMGSAYHYNTCEASQWTSFDQNANDVPTIRNLIANGNPTSLGVGDSVYVQTGTKSSLYDDLATQYPSGGDVSVAVVDQLNLGGAANIVAFAGFHIDSIDKQGKYIQGHFIANYITPGANGIGPYYGTYTPPRLAQ